MLTCFFSSCWSCYIESTDSRRVLVTQQDFVFAEFARVYHATANRRSFFKVSRFPRSAHDSYQKDHCLCRIRKRNAIAHCQKRVVCAPIRTRSSYQDHLCQKIEDYYFHSLFHSCQFSCEHCTPVQCIINLVSTTTLL